jgi:hypothetical protein
VEDLLALRHPRLPRPDRGLTRAEALWLVLLGVFATLLILWTLDREMDRARQRQAGDALDHLAGQLVLALGEDLSGWPEGVGALHGPGELPPGDWSGARPLAEVLPAGAFVPVDPWGGAYSVERTAAGTARLRCAGADGVLDAQDDARELG